MKHARLIIICLILGALLSQSIAALLSRQSTTATPTAAGNGLPRIFFTIDIPDQDTSLPTPIHNALLQFELPVEFKAEATEPLIGGTTFVDRPGVTRQLWNVYAEWKDTTFRASIDTVTAGFPFKSAADVQLSYSCYQPITFERAAAPNGYSPAREEWLKSLPPMLAESQWCEGMQLLGVEPRHGTYRTIRPNAPALAIHPLWPGLLANTAIYAAMGAALWLGATTLRNHHRRKRGRCTHCNHILANLTTCPECGTQQRSALQKESE